MIEKMEKIYIYSLREQSSDILEDLMRCGIVEPTRAESMLEEEQVKGLAASDGIDLSREEDLVLRLNECIDALKEFGEKRGLFYRKPSVTYKDLTNDQVLFETIKSCEAIEEIVKERAALQKELQKTEFEKAAFLPWRSVSGDISDFQTKCTKLICYILPQPRDAGDLAKAAEEKEVDAYFKRISEDEENCYVAALFHKKDEKAVREIVSLFGAKEFSLDGAEGTFEENIQRRDEKILRLKERIQTEEQKLKREAGKRQELEMACDAVQLRMDCLSMKDNALHTEKVDVITGWVVASQKDRVSRALEKRTCCYQYKEPEKDEEYPVLLKNSKLVAPFGALTEMYSLPDSRSMDTNWAIGLFFFIFFGMMLSDAGYGLILAVGGLGAAKLLDLGEGAKRLLTMLGISGISTIFWGLMYGSFFGDVIPTVAEVFFGKELELPQVIDPLSQPLVVLAMSCGLGIIHLFLGMGFKAYLMIKRGDKWGALFDVGFWYIFLIGLPLLILPGKLKLIGIVMSIGGALGLVLTQGRAKPTVFGKITSGIISLYDVTSYFSDVLSYSRILALGLATGVIASVVNIMGSLTGGGVIGAIVFIVIFAGGHALNMAINALGAYVHSARLQYVEFFGKYYEGGGEKFDPLRAKTKYVNVTEEK
ncbi:V-type ATP synthase subunit I [bacterium 210820-DFI.6.37]|nr:V-type ATP synthase subunit I [bacterium 210820-DFI.6.37]